MLFRSDSYQFRDENLAYESLRQIAQKRTLILISSNSDLFKRIQTHIEEFPNAKVILRPFDVQAVRLDNELRPAKHFNETAIRKEWGEIKVILNRNKIPVNTAAKALSYELSPNQIEIQSANATSTPSNSSEYLTGSIPVLIRQTYFPKWHQSDGKATYAATPFFTLVSLDQTVTLNYQRNRSDRLAGWLSLATLCLVVSYLLWGIIKLGLTRKS